MFPEEMGKGDGGKGGFSMEQGCVGMEGGLGSQEAPIHWHSGACGHAAAVTEQEENGDRKSVV